MQIIEVSGSPRQIGEQTGEATREAIERNLALHPVDPLRLAPRLGTYAQTLRRDLPGVLEEIEGLAAGADLSRETALALNFAVLPDGLRLDDGCSNVAVSGGPDGPLWGKNNDGGEPATQRTSLVRIVRPARGLPAIHVHFAGVVGVGDGMNAEGLCTGHSSVGSRFQMSDRFVGLREWNHHQLHRCRTTAEFVAAMATRPLRGKGSSMVVADRAGTICVLEAPCPLLQVRHPTGPRFVACANRYLLPPLVDADRRPPGHKEEATERLAVIERSLEPRETIGLAELDDALGRHEEPGGTCKHGDRIGRWTEYGVRAECAHARLHVNDGPPCEGKRHTVQL